jgi:Sulfotransferase domain
MPTRAERRRTHREARLAPRCHAGVDKRRPRPAPPQLKRPALGGRSETNAPSAPQGPPAVFHVTHWKAGSSWLTRILRRCARERVVNPRQSETHLVAQFMEDPIQPQRVYPRLYVTREEFEAVTLPSSWRRFVVIRDLRDTLVSAYFSVKLSHGENPALEEGRERLRAVGRDEGLLWMFDHFMVARSAEIQDSWCSAGEPLIRFEDLIERDVAILARVLIDHCELPLRRPGLRRVVERTRFESLSGGRARGQEDPTSHFRKGVAGDWRNYFNGPLRAAFKQRWGRLLVATGYERDNDW